MDLIVFKESQIKSKKIQNLKDNKKSIVNSGIEK